MEGLQQTLKVAEIVHKAEVSIRGIKHPVRPLY